MIGESTGALDLSLQKKYALISVGDFSSKQKSDNVAAAGKRHVIIL